MSLAAFQQTLSHAEPHEGFEGPEKTLEIDFILPLDCSASLRSLNTEHWSCILEEASCSILGSRHNAHFDAYLLSESSLFVYPSKCIIKTCGTTTLLRIIPVLLSLTEPLGLELEWVGFSRKNFIFPAKQQFPHRNFEDETAYLNTIVYGLAFVFGPLNSDHWLLYVADMKERTTHDSNDRSLDIMMFDLDPDVCAMFYKKNDLTAEEITNQTGIRQLAHGAHIHDHLFEPCGYSMNAQLEESYFTIHVTPESHCSYASFATNHCVTSYESTLKQVIAVFRPKRFTMTLFADEGAALEIDDPCFLRKIDVPCRSTKLCYTKSSMTQTQFESGYVCSMANFVTLKERSDSPLGPQLLSPS